MTRKVVFITGAAKGIGASIARVMARENYNVVINYLNSEKESITLKNELENEYKIDVLLLKGDISSENEVKRMVSLVKEHFGKIDCLVNNAALCMDNYFQDKNALEFQKVLNTNVVGTFLMCKYVGLEMLKEKKGCIINISSTNGIDTNEVYSMDYDASKAGIISLTHNFAKEFAPFIRVNTIAPGWTNTESVKEMNPNYLEEEKQKIMLNRFAEPKEIAEIACFLASDKASYINNAVIRVDGGIR